MIQDTHILYIYERGHDRYAGLNPKAYFDDYYRTQRPFIVGIGEKKELQVRAGLLEKALQIYNNLDPSLRPEITARNVFEIAKAIARAAEKGEPSVGSGYIALGDCLSDAELALTGFDSEMLTKLKIGWQII